MMMLCKERDEKKININYLNIIYVGKTNKTESSMRKINLIFIFASSHSHHHYYLLGCDDEEDYIRR